MNLSELDINLIEAYIEGTLQHKEKEAFEARLSADKAFADEVTIYKKLMRGIESYGATDFMAKVSQWEAATKQQAKQVNVAEPTPSPTGKVISMGNRPNYIKYIGLAAALALALFVGTQLFNNAGMTAQQAFNDNFEVYQDVITDRGTTDASTLQIGMGLYGKGEYKEATEALSKYITQEINNEVAPAELLPARFYLANAQLASGDIEGATTNFKIVSSSENSFQQQSDWFLALTFLKSNNIPNTKAQLNLILQNEKHSYAKKAKKLLEVIGEL